MELRETDVLIAGAGGTGRAVAEAAAAGGARVLLVDKDPERADPAVDGVEYLAGAMLLDVILSADGEVAGALVTQPDAWSVEPVRAKAVILATGGAAALWPGAPSPHATGDGLAIAHRAGADVEGLRPARENGHVDVEGGASTGTAGRTSVPGLWVAGRGAVHRVEGAVVGETVAHALPKKTPPFGDYAVMPNVDSPLPAGFVDVKLERLREIMAHHFGPDGPRDAEKGLTLLHQLKGEADEYARARVDNTLLSFKNACEVAVLLARRRMPLEG